MIFQWNVLKNSFHWHKIKNLSLINEPYKRQEVGLEISFEFSGKVQWLLVFAGPTVNMS